MYIDITEQSGRFAALSVDLDNNPQLQTVKDLFSHLKEQWSDDLAVTDDIEYVSSAGLSAETIVNP